MTQILVRTFSHELMAILNRDLNAKDKKTVVKLAGILRIADGLDCTHCDLVKNIDCNIRNNRVVLTCGSKETLDEEFSAAAGKADLFKKVFDKKLSFRHKPGR